MKWPQVSGISNPSFTTAIKHYDFMQNCSLKPLKTQTHTIYHDLNRAPSFLNTLLKRLNTFKMFSRSSDPKRKKNEWSSE